MTQLNQEMLAKFAGLVAKIWNDKTLADGYHKDPHRVLANYGIKLPEGVPVPLIPEPPTGGVGPEMGRAWKTLTFEDWNISIQNLDKLRRESGPMALKIVSLGCIACPYSCFSSISE